MIASQLARTYSREVRNILSNYIHVHAEDMPQAQLFANCLSQYSYLGVTEDMVREEFHKYMNGAGN